MEIIKFRTINQRFWEDLKSSSLYFNNIGNFNDPFEGIFRFKLWNDQKKIKEFYLHHFSGNPEKVSFYMERPAELEKLINRTFEYQVMHNGVTCFSEVENSTNILMWAHYGNDHKGVCLVFESDELHFRPGPAILEDLAKRNSVMTSPKGPFSIKYTDKYLDGDPLNGNLNQQSFLTTKFSAWKGERELRYISAGQGLFEYPPAALKRVIFGLRTLQKDRAGIRNIIQQLGITVEFQTIQLKDSDFNFELVPEYIETEK